MTRGRVIAGLERPARRRRASPPATWPSWSTAPRSRPTPSSSGAGPGRALLTTAGFRDVLELRRCALPRLYDLDFEPPGAAGAAPLAARGGRAHRLPAARSSRPLDRASVARRRSSGSWRRASRRSPSASSTPTATRPRAGGRRARARARARRLPQLLSATCCRRSASTSGPARRSSTPTSSRSSPLPRPAGDRPGRARRRPAGPGDAVERRPDVGGARRAGRPSTSSSRARRPASSPPRPLARRLGAAEPDLPRHGRHDGQGVPRSRAAQISARASTRSAAHLAVQPALQGRRLPAAAARVDIAEVGAGGGSIVSLDAAGALQVGPHSAGAVPGPACYDLGGTAGRSPTPTSASGYLNPERLASGAPARRRPRADAPSPSRSPAPLGLSLLDAAHGVTARRATAWPARSRPCRTYRGRDPRDFALLAFGGNGPIFAARWPRALGIGRVARPAGAGRLLRARAARGRGRAPPRADVPAPAGRRRPESWPARLADLERGRRATPARRERRAGDRRGRPRAADLSYAGAVVRAVVPVPGVAPPRRPAAARRRVRPGARADLRPPAEGDPIQVVNLRADRAGRRPADRPAIRVAPPARRGRRDTPGLLRARPRRRADARARPRRPGPDAAPGPAARRRIRRDHARASGLPGLARRVGQHRHRHR